MDLAHGRQYLSDAFLGGLFRFVFYVLFGFFLEVTYAVIGIERSCGAPLQRRVPKKYLEGFVSLYMLPIHGFGMLFGFEAIHPQIVHWPIWVRFIVWAVIITGGEALAGFVYLKTLGFYSWDYYRDSRFKIFKEGLTLWTLLPQWGLAGLVFEQFSSLLLALTPTAVSHFQNLF